MVWEGVGIRANPFWYVLSLLLLALLYFISAKVGLCLAFAHVQVSPVWPPTGIALAAVFLFGPRMTVAVAIGAFLVNYYVGGHTVSAMVIGVGNALEALAGALMARAWISSPYPLDRANDYLKFLCASLVSPLISATFGTFAIELNGSAGWSSFFPLWVTWWLGDAVGAIVVAPVLLAWARGGLRFSRASLLEAAALLLGLGIAAGVVFGDWIFGVAKHYPIEYLCLFFLVWAALRFGQKGVTTCLLLLSSLAILGTMRGMGPFHGQSPNESLLLLQAFLGTTSIVSLLLAAIIAEQKQAKDRLVATNAELERYAYVVSHDLQEPLRTINSHLGLIAKRCGDRLDSDSASFLAFARDGAARMHAMIRDLLRYSRVGSEHEEAGVDCNVLFEEIRRNLEVTIRESGAAVTVGELPLLRADRTRLLLLFQNLIDNAIKFRANRAPEIAISGSWGRRDYVFLVKDNGIGIAMDKADQLFVPFQRLHSESEYPGTGIGLANCKRIAESMGGKIWLESRPGEGASFFVGVPLWRVARRLTSSPA